MSTVLPLTGAPGERQPAPCVDCVFWQTRTGVSDGVRKARWVADADREGRPYGRVIHEDGRLRGLLQYGPSRLFPRARRMPAGPPSATGAVVTCAYLAPEDPAGTCERLFLEALADLKARGVPHVDAFAVRHPPETPRRDRFRAHHTLFDRDFLGSLGFTEVRSDGPVALMRLELGGLVPGATLTERLARRLRRPAPAGPPAPA